MSKDAANYAETDNEQSNSVTLKWSDILESAFDYYYTEYIPAWTLSETRHNNPGDKLFISKKNKEWVSWETVDDADRPHIATLFDLLPDLPDDEAYWELIKKLREEGNEEPEDHFWENIFTYRSAKEIETKGKLYIIELEA